MSRGVEPVATIPFLKTFFKIGVLSFGGPASQVAVMQRVVIDERGWLEEREFLSALSFCMLLPGPEAMQLATWLGWRLRGTAGGVVAGLLFVLPGAIVMGLLAALYVRFGTLPLVSVLFVGVKAAVIAVVIGALIKLSKRALQDGVSRCLAVAAFVAMFVFSLPFPVVILAAGLAGLFWTRGDTLPAVGNTGTASIRGTVRTVAVWLAVWWAPLGMLALVDPHGLLWQIGSFFSTLAVLSFGGAYAVLAWLAQDAVGHYQWLTTAQMIDGLGLAETTPGPLILVTEFVGYLAGSAQGGVGLAIAAALVTLWATFIPCFLWIFTGAPWLDWVCGQPRLSNALRAITAAVVGVMLNLSVWFAAHVLFAEVDRTTLFGTAMPKPDWSTLDGIAVLIFAVSAVALFRFKCGVVSVLGIACAASVALHQLL